VKRGVFEKQRVTNTRSRLSGTATGMCALVDIPFFSRHNSQRSFHDGIGGFDGHLAGDILLDHRLPNMGLDAPLAFGRRPTSPPSPGASLARLARMTSPFGELHSRDADLEWHMAEDEMRRRVSDEGPARSALRTRIERLDNDEDDPEATDPEQSGVEPSPGSDGPGSGDDLSNLANEAKAAQRKVHELRSQLEEQARLAHEAEVRLRMAAHRARTTQASMPSRGAAV
jgi:hypothetical protein